MTIKDLPDAFVILGTWAPDHKFVSTVDIFSVELRMEEQRVAHPAEASNLVATPILKLLEDQLQTRLLDGVTSQGACSWIGAFLLLRLFALELAAWDGDTVRIPHIPVVLVLVQNQPESIVSSHKLIQLG